MWRMIGLSDFRRAFRIVGDPSQGEKMNKKEITNNGRINNAAQMFGIKRYTLNGGAEDGLRVIECTNGALRFLLNESKALDIMQIFYKGENMSFVSKNGFTKREIPFAERFEGGALYTCGLDAAGGVEGKEIHGSFHNIPATVLRAECGDEGITVEAEIRYSALFNRNLVLRRRVFSAYGGGTLEITDVLTNEGTKTEDYCLLYHSNLGYPLLAEGGKIIAETGKVEPRSDYAEKKLASWDTVEAPKDNEPEVCYYLSPADRTVYYFNPKSGRKFTLKYSDNLDKFVLWKSNASGDYALGLEPSTTELDEGFAYKRIAAGESKTFVVSYSIE